MSEPSTSAPAPSKHIFLHELVKQPGGAKVRFLCCVLDYDATKGHLLVEHAYPHDATPTPRAAVDVNLVLETVQSELLHNGRWVNVLGYVQGGPQMQIKAKTKRSEIPPSNIGREAMVQAVLIWDAGAIRANEYEKTMEQQREAWRKTRHLHEDIK